MEATFTPGPWEYRYNPTTDSHYVGQGLCCIVSDVYATEETVDKGFHEREANARLIAAAPRMYEFIAARAADGDEEARSILGEVHANS